MRPVAFLFPGQGAKRVHEALRFVARSEAGRARCEAAARAAEVELGQVIARPSMLDRTDVLQPILTAIAVAIGERLAEAGIRPDVVLGHSAGEIAAWASAGGLSGEEAIALAAARGRWMAREAAAHPGGMAAVASSDPEVIERALAAGRRAGDLCVAAHNAPDETVLSGDEAAIRALLAFSSATGAATGAATATATGAATATARVMETATATGTVTRIPTAGAWHSPAMRGAVGEWRQALSAIEPRPLQCRFVANRTGEIEEDIPPLLAEQLTHPVLWARALATVRREAGVVVTIGPGAVLRALWHRCLGRGEGAAAGDAGARSRVSDSPAEGRGGGEWKLLATEDERSTAETMGYLRGTG